MDLVEKVVNGGRITREEAIFLYKNASLEALALGANAVKLRFNSPDVATYLVDRNINYTNVCNTDCSFCAFYRHDPNHPEAYVNSREVLAKKIEEALELGATRILLQGGHNDTLPYQYYIDLISWIHSTYPIELNAFSPSEIQQMMKISGKTALQVLTELKAVGLGGLPGGGAEMLDDEIRKRVSPKKIKADEWISIMEDAHSLGLTTSSTMVIGFGETIENRMNHFERLRNLQDRSQKRGLKGFNLFVSWPLQSNENTSIGRSRHIDKFGATTDEYFRNLALGRIFLDNIPHHQSGWPTLGGEVAKTGLLLGCDDIGSTMMEENVVSKAGAASKDRWSMSPEELREYIRAAGFIPAQRNSSFEIVRIFNEESPNRNTSIGDSSLR